MAKILYLPFSIVSGLIARLLGRTLFRAVWARVDQEAPPVPGDGRGSTGKVVAGRALQAAVMVGSAAFVERVFARAFHHILGVWPRKPPKPDKD